MDHTTLPDTTNPLCDPITTGAKYPVYSVGITDYIISAAVYFNPRKVVPVVSDVNEHR